MRVKIVALCCVSLMMIFTNCEKIKETIDELAKFDLPFTQEFTLPSTSGVNVPVDITTPDIQSNLEEQLAENSSSTDMIEAVTLKELNLTLLQPSGADFGFMKSIEISMIAGGTTERVAWLDSVPSPATAELSLNTSSADVRDLLLEENFKLKITLVNNQGLTEDHEMEMEMIFEVDAKVLE